MQIITERLPYTAETMVLDPSAFLAHAAPTLTAYQRYVAIVELLPFHRQMIEAAWFWWFVAWRA